MYTKIHPNEKWETSTTLMTSTPRPFRLEDINSISHPSANNNIDQPRWRPHGNFFQCGLSVTVSIFTPRLRNLLTVMSKFSMGMFQLGVRTNGLCMQLHTQVTRTLRYATLRCAALRALVSERGWKVFHFKCPVAQEPSFPTVLPYRPSLPASGGLRRLRRSHQIRFNWPFLGCPTVWFGDDLSGGRASFSCKVSFEI